MLASSFRLRTWLVVGCLVGLVSSCSSSGTDAGPSPSDGPASLQSVLEEARVSEASDEQIAILEEAVAAGELSFEQAEAAVFASLQCFEKGGLRSGYTGPLTLPSGLVYPEYVYGPSLGQDETQAMNIADACQEEHSRYVEKAYQLQPSSLVLEDVYFESRRSSILTCLRDNGVTIDEDATRDEIERASAELQSGMSWDELEKAAREAQESGGVLIIGENGVIGPDCLYDPELD